MRTYFYFAFTLLSSALTLLSFAISPEEEAYMKGFLEGYRQGSIDALEKLKEDEKVVKNLKEPTKIIEYLLKGEGKKYLYLYKTKCGQEYYLFIPQKAKDFPQLLKLSNELKNKIQIREGYYVFVHTEEYPSEIVGLLKFLAQQKGFQPFFVKDLLVFAVEDTESSASYDTKLLNSLFKKYLENTVKVSYKYISPSIDDIDLLLKVENWTP